MVLALKEAGLSEEAIIATMNATFGGGDGQGQPQQRTPAMGDNLGPDPNMVAEYKKRMAAGYVSPKHEFSFGALSKDEPELRERLIAYLGDLDLGEHVPGDIANDLLAVLDGYGGVVLPKHMVQWCVQWQSWEMMIRKMKPGQVFSERQTLGSMVRQHWGSHPVERAAMRAAEHPGVATGPASQFHPDQGRWS